MQPLSDKIAEERDQNNQPLLAILVRQYEDKAEKLPLEQVQEQALAHVFERLQAHIKQEQSVSPASAQVMPIPRKVQERQQGEFETTERRSPTKRPRYQFLGQIAAEFFLVLLVGSLITVFSLTRPFGNGSPYTGTALYIVRNSTVYKLAADTGKPLWRYDMAGASFSPVSPITPLVSHGVVYTSFQQNLYAVNASNGSVIWKKQFSERSRPIPWVVANDRLYVTSGIHIYALDSVKGTIQWYHDVQWAQGSVLAMQSDPSGIYAILFNAHGDTEYQVASLVALEISTGQERWRIPTTPPELYNSGSHIENNYGNTNKQMSILNGSVYFTTVVHIPNNTVICAYAASTSNGAIVWRSTPVEYMDQVIPRVNTVYLLSPSDVYALNSKNGMVLWRHKGDIAINETVLVTPTTLSFLETNLHGDYLTIMNVKNGSIESRQLLDDAYRLAIDTSLPTDRGGPYYTASARKVLIDARTTYVGVFKNGFLEAFNNQNGTLLWSYTFSDANGIGASPFAIVEAS